MHLSEVIDLAMSAGPDGPASDLQKQATCRATEETKEKPTPGIIRTPLRSRNWLDGGKP